MKSLLYISILLITAYNLSAQQVIKGTVTDAGNGQPVDAATVQIRKTGRQLPLTYTLTKADGTFILPLHQADDSLFVHVSLLGYKAIRQKITAGTRLLIRLEPEIFTLKEVEIRPGRVYGQHDTINYDVSQFISPKDEAIKDVLKKLPGVEREDEGAVGLCQGVGQRELPSGFTYLHGMQIIVKGEDGQPMHPKNTPYNPIEKE